VHIGEKYMVLKETKVSAFSERPNNGQFKLFYPNGHLKAIEHYAYGKRDGIWEYFHVNGKISKSVPYDHDSIHGNVYHFSTDGMPVYTEVFENNTLIDRIINDDSLYHLAVVLPNRGKNLYLTQCNTCHEAVSAFSKKISTDFQADSLVNLMDLHVNLHDDSTESHDLREVLVQSDSLSGADIEALHLYLEKCQEEADIMTYTSPVRKVSNTVDRRKLSLLEDK